MKTPLILRPFEKLWELCPATALDPRFRLGESILYSLVQVLRFNTPRDITCSVHKKILRSGYYDFYTLNKRALPDEVEFIILILFSPTQCVLQHNGRIKTRWLGESYNGSAIIKLILFLELFLFPTSSTFLTPKSIIHQPAARRSSGVVKV